MSLFIDYSGKKIGRVKVISYAGKTSQKSSSRWNCICDCGANFITASGRFSRGEKFECKDCVNERRRGVDLTGRQFGRWTVLGRTVDCRNRTAWNCVCDCGNYGIVSGGALGRKHKSWSCGCYGRKMKSKYVNSTLYPPSHKISDTPFYKMRVGLVHKCYKEKNCSYPLFGAKGITVCDLWINSAKDMYEWALSKGWEKGDVICLKYGEKEFNPDTVYLIKEGDFRSEVGLKGGTQISYNGETHSVSKWAEMLGTTQFSLRRKLSKNPSIEEVFNSKFRTWHISKNPEMIQKFVDLYKSGKSQIEIAKMFNIHDANIRYHLIKNNVVLRESENRRLKRPKL